MTGLYLFLTLTHELYPTTYFSNWNCKTVHAVELFNLVTQVYDTLNNFADMASQTQGIQQLLQAEKRAAEKVAEARKREYFLYITEP